MVAEVFAFEVWPVQKPEWARTINARTGGKAKAEYHLSINDAGWDVPFTDIRVRKIGKPHSSEQFIRNAEYRGMPDIRCGDRVTVGGTGSGTVVGHTSSANFEVLFDDDSPKYAGLKLSVHPSELQVEVSA